jgi:two-component system NtrC family response regulator
MKSEWNQSGPALLLVEDDAEIREQMKWALGSEYAVLEAQDRRSALALVRRETPRLVVLDLGLPPAPDAASEGLAALQEIIQFDPTTKVIIATGYSDRAVALNAIQNGAYDFFEKPVQLDVLRVILQRAAYLSRLEQENRALQEQASTSGLGELIGESPPIQHIFEMIRRVAASDVPVLITGESGTGKELVARAIHRHGTRKGGPFIAINCGAIPENLLESELFGHEKGAFTGAHRQQKGKVEYAHAGTLLLDEIGEMPLGLQVKLLRFLQDGQLERVGGREPITVDTRILAATNSDIKAAIERGLFRKDLYYRLSVIEIPVPPLRERGEDAVMLAQAFILRYREALKARVTGLSDEAREAVRAYAWPGNVRELENRIKRAVIMAKSPVLQPADLELPSSGSATRPPTLKEARARVEKEFIQRALTSHNWNISRAAEDVGISRQSLHEFIQKYGLQKPSLTEQPPGPATVTDES